MSAPDASSDPAAILGRRLETEPEDAEARRALVELLLERGQPELARRTLSAGLGDGDPALKALEAHVGRSPADAPGVRRSPAPGACWSGGCGTTMLLLLALAAACLAGNGVALLPAALRWIDRRALLADLDAPDPAARVQAARRLLDEGHPEAEAPIAAALDPAGIESPETARAAVRVLARLQRGARVEADLAAALAHDAAGVRRGAARALGRPHDHGEGTRPRSAASAEAWYAAKAAYDARPQLRGDLLHYLAHPAEDGPRRRAGGVLLAAWRGDDAGLRRGALRHVECLPPEVPDAQRLAFWGDALERGHSGHVREVTVYLLLDSGTSFAELDAGPARAATERLRAMRSLDSEQAAHALLALLRHRAPDVRAAAAGALGERFGPAEETERGRSRRPDTLDLDVWARVLEVYHRRPELRAALLPILGAPPEGRAPAAAEALLDARASGPPLAGAALAHVDVVAAGGARLDERRVEAFVRAALERSEPDRERALDAGLAIGLFEAGRRFLRGLDASSRERGRPKRAAPPYGRNERARKAQGPSRPASAGWVRERAKRLTAFDREALERLAALELGARAEQVLERVYRRRGWSEWEEER